MGVTREVGVPGSRSWIKRESRAGLGRIEPHALEVVWDSSGPTRAIAEGEVLAFVLGIVREIAHDLLLFLDWERGILSRNR